VAIDIAVWFSRSTTISLPRTGPVTGGSRSAVRTAFTVVNAPLGAFMSTGRTAATVPLVILPVNGEVSGGACGIGACAQAAMLRQSAMNKCGRHCCARDWGIIVFLM